MQQPIRYIAMYVVLSLLQTHADNAYIESLLMTAITSMEAAMMNPEV